MVEELVVLLSEEGDSIGQELKSEVHGSHTPLHLAFSCYLMNEEGELLITRRSLSKLTWPGVWTNSFCGHPAPGEPMSDAVHRRAMFELGVEISEAQLVLPNFRYQATDASGIVENEICPVFIAKIVTPLVLNPAEVMETAWVSPQKLFAAVNAAPGLVSPWMVEQVSELEAANVMLASELVI